jgi:hypothetical protein
MSGINSPFITDMGQSHTVRDVKTGQSVMYVPRYGVWCFDPAKGTMQVAETHDDLAYLQTKYGIGAERVFSLSAQGGRQ